MKDTVGEMRSEQAQRPGPMVWGFREGSGVHPL